MNLAGTQAPGLWRRFAFCVGALLVAMPLCAACPDGSRLSLESFRERMKQLATQESRDAASACLRAEIARISSRDAIRAAELRRDLARLLEEAGDFAGARTQLEPALRVLEQKQRYLPLAEAARQIGWVEYRLGDYPSAETHMRRALELEIKYHDPRHINVGRVHNSLGVLLRDRGEYEQAERTFRAALAIATAQSDHDHDDLAAVVHNNVAGLWYHRGDLRQAVQEYDAARRLFLALYGERNIDVAMVYHNIGFMYQELGAYAEAERWYNKALPVKVALFGAEHPTVASTVANLGLLADNRNKQEEAQKQYQRALDIYIGKFGRTHPNVAIVSTLLGGLELRMGRPQQAREHLEHALTIRERAVGPNGADVADTLNYLGPTYQALGRPQQARATLERAVAISIPADAAETLWEGYAAYARVLANQGAFSAAVFYGKHAVNVIQSLRVNLATLRRPLQRSFLARREPAYRELADTLITVGRIPEAQQILDMLKEEEYLDYMRTRAAVEDFGALRADFTDYEQPFAERLRTTADKLKQDPARDDVRSQLTALLEEITSALPSQTVRKKKDPKDRAFASVVTPGEASAVIRYVVMQDRVRILAATGKEQLQRDTRIPVATLNRQVFDLRQQLQDPRSDPRAAAGELYRHLITPVEAVVKAKNVRRVLIVSDGTLRYLPFAALFDGKRYLVETREVMIATPAARSRTAAGAVARPQHIAAFGITKASEGLQALPRVAVELDRIVKRDESDRDGVLPGTIALDEAFTAERLRDALAEGAPTVHIASHFVFRPGPVGESFLLLGGGSRLTLDELRTDRYLARDVQLLTLSACETAVGQPDATGAEFESFGVLAQRQGARAVLATLWPVRDLSTATFMARFYRERQSAGDTSTALRRAQLAFLQRENARPTASVYRHPFYWAPYVLMGSPGG